MDSQVVLGFMNLHDAFLNASLIRHRMLKEPVHPDLAIFHATDRGRFERLWIALLAVLIEAWHAPQTRPVRDYIASVASTDNLVVILRQIRSSGHQDKMMQCRHYMFHRDKREFWDEGRAVPVGNLDLHTDLHKEFGQLLLAASEAIKGELGIEASAPYPPSVRTPEA